MTRAAPLIAAAVFLAAILAFRLEPARVEISGDDAPPPARIDRSYAGAMRTMSSVPLTTSTTWTAVPTVCSAATTSANTAVTFPQLCQTAVRISQ